MSGEHFFINISNFQTLISSEQEQLTVEQKYNISEQENTMSKNKKNNKKKEIKSFAWQALTIDLEAAFPGQFPVVPCPPPVGLSPFYRFRALKQANLQYIWIYLYL